MKRTLYTALLLVVVGTVNVNAGEPYERSRVGPEAARQEYLAANDPATFHRSTGFSTDYAGSATSRLVLPDGEADLKRSAGSLSPDRGVVPALQERRTEGSGFSGWMNY